MITIDDYNSTEFREISDRLNKNSNTELADYTFNLPLRFKKEEWKTSHVTFRDCIFLQAFHLSELDLHAGIRFENCRFEMGFQAYRCTGGYAGHRYSFRENSLISFVNCQIEKGINVQQCEFQQGINIMAATVVDKLMVTTGKITAIHIEQSTIQDILEISKVIFEQGTYFERSVLDGPVTIYENEGCLHFRGSNCAQTLLIRNNSLSDLVFKEGAFKDEISITDNTVSHEAIFRNSLFEKEIIFKHRSSFSQADTPVNRLEVDACDFRGGFLANCETLGRNIDVNQVVLRPSAALKGAVTFHHWCIAELSLSGINQTGISLTYCMVDRFLCNDFVNLAALNLYTIQPFSRGNSFFQLSRSVMGKTFLSNVDFQQYESILIQRVNLTEILSTSVHWFRKEQLVIEHLTASPIGRSYYHLLKDQVEAILKYQARKEIYRQLKFAMEKQGDNLNRLKFKKEELAAYRKELKYWRSNREHLGDRMILWLGQSNDYGFNWLRPALLILMVTIILNPVLAISANPDLHWWPDLSNTWQTLNYLGKTAYNMFNLLNPAHKISELLELKNAPTPSFFFYFVDFLDRLIVSYLLFQMVIAFRKYSN